MERDYPQEIRANAPRWLLSGGGHPPEDPQSYRLKTLNICVKYIWSQYPACPANPYSFGWATYHVSAAFSGSGGSLDQDFKESWEHGPYGYCVGSVTWDKWAVNLANGLPDILGQMRDVFLSHYWSALEDEPATREQVAGDVLLPLLATPRMRGLLNRLDGAKILAKSYVELTTPSLYFQGSGDWLLNGANGFSLPDSGTIVYVINCLADRREPKECGSKKMAATAELIGRYGWGGHVTYAGALKLDSVYIDPATRNTIRDYFGQDDLYPLIDPSLGLLVDHTSTSNPPEFESYAIVDDALIRLTAALQKAEN